MNPNKRQLEARQDEGERTMVDLRLLSDQLYANTSAEINEPRLCRQTVDADMFNHPNLSLLFSYRGLFYLPAAGIVSRIPSVWSGPARSSEQLSSGCTFLIQ